ncbi:SAF domain-containing protein [Kineosporia sp. NBRC 101677]|uniref:SAF domain-containing protein n=1 Tax=Kineosporia sp. NBRC 101677 TaxID=3032197 RepID=UPI002555669E|nr:SAF domain-containing protein [Kineosporia sp. NBRC 101677]
MATLVLCVAVASVVGLLVVRSGAKTPVLVLANRVPESQVITREDLTTAAVAGDVSAISAESIEQVVGQRAVYTLEAGAILQAQALAPAQDPNATQASVGVSVAAGLAPKGLRAGDRVQVLQIPEPDNGSDEDGFGSSASATLLADGALITDVVEDSSSSGDLLVTMRVAPDAGASLMVASSRGQVGLMKVGAA